MHVMPAAAAQDHARRFTIADLAARIHARLIGTGDVVITGLSAIDQARPDGGDLTFIAEARYAAKWAESKAIAAVVSERLEVPSDQRPLLAVGNVEHAMIALLELFLPPEDRPQPGVHATAVVDPSVKIGRGVCIGPHVSVGPNVTLGDNVILHAGVRIYSAACIGEDSIIHSNTVIRERCVVGRRVIMHQNVSIGADGFGYRPAPDGRGLLKMPHIGLVVVEDDVEIGAGTCIDRGKFGSTHIGAGTKIDNLCQIGHNARIGRCCVIAGCVAISGSAVIGDACQIGGQSAFAPHVRVGSNVKVAATAAVLHDTADGMTIAGVPAIDSRTAMREYLAMKKLPALLRQMAHLTKETASE